MKTHHLNLNYICNDSNVYILLCGIRQYQSRVCVFIALLLDNWRVKEKNIYKLFKI